MVKRLSVMVEHQKRKRRPKRKWVDSSQQDLTENGIQGIVASYRPTGLIGGEYSDTSTHIKVGKDADDDEEVVEQIYLIRYYIMHLLLTN